MPNSIQSPVRVLLAEDNDSVRTRLSLALSATPGVSVLETTGSLIAALHRAKELRPDLIVFGRTLLANRASDVLRAVMSMEDAPHILVLGPERAGEVNRMAMTDGFVPLAKPGLAAVASASMAALQKPTTSLSRRECEVLQLVASGLSSRQAASKLGLSVRTVENHRARIGRRTGLRSVAQLTLYAAQRGLVPSVPAAPAAAPTPFSQAS